MIGYDAFLASKRREWIGESLPGARAPIHDLYPFQAQLVMWACRKGRAALWADTGLGKTRMQVAWAATVPGRVLILAPLCVGPQTIAEAARIGVTVGEFGAGARIEITNYERLHRTDPSVYAGVVLDESSILKSMDGKTRTRLIAMFQDTPARLCCTATPAPNDIAELANHCEFLGIMTRVEMLATFFVHDETGWRLKGHAAPAFYRWLASWGMFLRRPSDLGFEDTGYELPGLTIVQDVVPDVAGTPMGDYLFSGMGLGGIQGRSKARRLSLKARCDRAIQIVESTADAWIIWCGMNDEQDHIADALDGACVSIQGSDSESAKHERLTAFIEGRTRVLVTKPRIAGFGLNLQRCHQMAFVGLGDSYEQYYQAIRRCYRFGQSSHVRVHVIVSEAETEIVRNVQRKEALAADVSAALVASMREAEMEEISMTRRQRVDEGASEIHGESWTLRQGDCVDVLAQLPEGCADLSVYSPPFLSLFTYTNSERDLGNCSTRAEFLEHFGYVVRGLLRATKPGRITCCHVSQVATTLSAHGVIGLADLRGAAIECFVNNGWVYHGDICIDKDPQAQAIRTHAKGLLFAQLKKDASWLRPGLADYILVFRKPGAVAVPIHPDISNDDWIRWARPVWYGIRESDTLNAREARASDDDRHICPLQLGVIERCVRLWSNKGEMVLSPFAGIGSEGYQAIRLERRYIGIELKAEYVAAAAKNLRRAESNSRGQLGFPGMPIHG